MHPSDDRAQAIQIGALFIFAFLIIGLSIAQLYVVPNQNGEVEFNHNRQAQDQMIDLRSKVLRTAATGESRPAAVTLGATYPSRSLLVNPAPPGGTLRTESLGDYVIDNAKATDTEADDYWDGNPRTFTTKRIVYQPGYNYYDRAPVTIFENSVLYNEFPSENVTVESSTLVTGRTINLVVIGGSVSSSGTGSTTVEPVAVGGAAQTVQVEADDGPVTLTVPTDLSQRAWESLLESERDGTGTDQRYVAGLSCSNVAAGPDSDAACEELTLTFEEGAAYNLVVGEAGLGSSFDRSHADPEYVVTTDGDGATVPEGTSRQLTVEVRNRYDNPVSGETVRFQVTDPRAGSLDSDSLRSTYANGSITTTTDLNGRATVTYEAPLNVERRVGPSVVATALKAPEGGSPRLDQATFEVNVQDEDEEVSNDDWSRPLVTAVEPDPAGGSENDEEFVALYVPDDIDASNYVLEGNESGEDGTATISQLSSEPSGTVFVTEDTGPGGFTPPDGSTAEVVEYAGSYDGLPDDAGVVQLRNTTTGEVVDQVAYGDKTTLDGWSVADESDPPDDNLPEGDLIERATEDGAFVDTNASSDWSRVGEDTYFDGGGGGPPVPPGVGPPPGRGPRLRPPQATLP